MSGGVRCIDDVLNKVLEKVFIISGDFWCIKGFLDFAKKIFPVEVLLFDGGVCHSDSFFTVCEKAFLVCNSSVFVGKNAFLFPEMVSVKQYFISLNTS